MKRFILYALLKALVISIGFDFICIMYGLVSHNPYKISITGSVIFFCILFLAELMEHLWKNRKK